MLRVFIRAYAYIQPIAQDFLIIATQC